MMGMADVVPARLWLIGFPAARFNISSGWLRQEPMGAGGVDHRRPDRSSRSP